MRIGHFFLLVVVICLGTTTAVTNFKQVKDSTGINVASDKVRGSPRLLNGISRLLRVNEKKQDALSDDGSDREERNPGAVLAHAILESGKSNNVAKATLQQFSSIKKDVNPYAERFKLWLQQNKDPEEVKKLLGVGHDYIVKSYEHHYKIYQSQNTEPARKAAAELKRMKSFESKSYKDKLEIWLRQNKGPEEVKKLLGVGHDYIVESYQFYYKLLQEGRLTFKA